jgi:hypothetical protein
VSFAAITLRVLLSECLLLLSLLFRPETFGYTLVYRSPRIVRIVICRTLLWAEYLVRMGRQDTEFLWGNLLKNIN